MKRFAIALTALLLTVLAFATVPTDSATTAGPYACDGADTTFTFSFGIDTTADLQVILITAATGAESTLVFPTDYTITSANTNDPQDFTSGGTVTTVATYSSAYQILLRRLTTKTQTANLDDEDVEEALDKLTRIAQDQAFTLGLCLKVQPSEAGDTVQLPAKGTAGYLYRQAGGDVIVAVIDSTLAAQPADANLTTLGSILGRWQRIVTNTTPTDADRISAKADMRLNHVFDVRDYGAVNDPTVDSTVAIQAAIDAAGSGSWGGGVVLLPGVYGIFDSLTMSNCSVTLRGIGWGNITNGTGSALHWIGDSNEPMLIIQDCEGAGVENLRFMGDSTHPPYAAIQLIETNDGNQNAWNHYANLWIGKAPFDAAHDYDESLENGILIGGTGSLTSNNCESKWDSIYISGCATGIKVTSTQHQNHSFNNVNLWYCSTAGINAAANTTISNIYCSQNAVDISQTFQNASPVINIEMFTSELAGRMVYTAYDLTLHVRGGYWQSHDDYLNADAAFISCVNNQNQSITLEDFALTGYSGHFTTVPLISMKASPGGASCKTLRILGNKYQSIGSANLDMNPGAAANNKTVIEVKDDGYYGAYVQEEWRNELGPSGTVDASYYDLPTTKIVRATKLADGSGVRMVTKTKKITVGHVGETTTDFAWATAAGHAAANLDLGAAIPAHARVLDVTTICTEDLVGQSDITIGAGNAAGGTQFFAAASCDDLDDTVASAAGAAAFVEASNAAQHLWLVGDPTDANWSDQTAGTWAVYVTYVDIASAE